LGRRRRRVVLGGSPSPVAAPVTTAVKEEEDKAVMEDGADIGTAPMESPAPTAAPAGPDPRNPVTDDEEEEEDDAVRVMPKRSPPPAPMITLGPPRLEGVESGCKPCECSEGMV